MATLKLFLLVTFYILKFIVFISWDFLVIVFKVVHYGDKEKYSPNDRPIYFNYRTDEFDPVKRHDGIYDKFY